VRPGHAVHVVDYKTARSAVRVDEAAASLQLGFYMLAAAQDPRTASLGQVAGAEMWFPAADTQKVSVRRFEPDRLGEVQGLMVRAANGIRQEDWSPVPGDHCRHCQVRRVCPEWPEGREAYLG